MTKLSKPVSRATEKNFKHYGRPLVVTLVPDHGDRDDMIAMRLQGTREPYLARIADLYTMLALWHGNKLSAAKRAARKAGIPWRQARRDFQRSNTIPKAVSKTVSSEAERRQTP